MALAVVATTTTAEHGTHRDKATDADPAVVVSFFDVR